MTRQGPALLLGAALALGAAGAAWADCLDGPLREVVFRSSLGRDGQYFYDLQVRNGTRDQRLAVTVRFTAPGVRNAARDAIYALTPREGLRASLGVGTREMTEEELRAATVVRCRAF